MKKSHKLLGWMFNALYWFDLTNIAKKKWKERLYELYLKSDIAKGFKEGSFCKAWKFIRTEHLIREGRESKHKKFRHRKKEEE